MPTSCSNQLRVPRRALAVVAAAGAAVLAACSAGGADASLWDPGNGEPPVEGTGGAGSSSGTTTNGASSSSGKTSTSSSGKTSTSSSSTSSASSSTSSTSGGAPTWTQIYTGVFGPNGTSTCGGSSCHTGSRSGFACGTTATSCYNGFVNSGYLITGSSAPSSPLIDPLQTCLCGSGLTGNMPKGHKCLTAAQVSEIKAWLATGAPDN